MQIGDKSPDVEIGQLKAAFEVTQQLLEARQISAGHDISDGGIVVALLEMAFAGNTGIQVALPAAADGSDAMAALFAEELGLLLEVDAAAEAAVVDAYRSAGLPVTQLGSGAATGDVSISVGGQEQITGGHPAHAPHTLQAACEGSPHTLAALSAQVARSVLLYGIHAWDVLRPSS